MTESNEALWALGNRVLAAQPFSVMLGAELARLEPGVAELQIPVRAELLQQHGFVHGGVVSYAADNAITYAGGSVLGDSVTAEYKINYVRPAVGERLIARARVIRAGKQQAVCQCEVFSVRDGEEKLCAFALGSVNKVG